MAPRDPGKNSSRGRRGPPRPAVDIEELLRYITLNLVDAEDEVEVTLVEERDADVYEIEVGDDDLGKIIGRGGKTARAIRSLVNVVAPRPGKRCLVEILE